MVRFKMTFSDKVQKPKKGYYTKIAKIIIEEFMKGNQPYATVENIEGVEESKLYNIYNAMQSLKKRKKINIEISIDMKEKKLHLSKVCERAK